MEVVVANRHAGLVTNTAQKQAGDADSQYSQRTAEGQARLAMAAGALLALLLLAYGWRRAAKQQRVHDKST